MEEEAEDLTHRHQRQSHHHLVSNTASIIILLRCCMFFPLISYRLNTHGPDSIIITIKMNWVQPITLIFIN